MHTASFEEMKRILPSYIIPNRESKVCDVGSYDVNGTYKPLFVNTKCQYVGIDIRQGPNVDLVVPHYDWSKIIPDNTFDMVISGQTIEHVEAPWLWILEIKRICKHNGIIIVTGPSATEEHKHPVDCWRILCDGMNYLLGTHARLRVISTYYIQGRRRRQDCWGIAQKI